MNDISKLMLIMTLTLLGYTLGVQFEKRVDNKKPLHLVLLWASFCMNAVGFGMLTRTYEGTTGLGVSLCRIMGILALIVLMIHSIWGTAVQVLKEEKSMRIYHRDSTLLWKIWLLPFALQLLMAVIV